MDTLTADLFRVGDSVAVTGNGLCQERCEVVIIPEVGTPRSNLGMIAIRPFYCWQDVYYWVNVKNCTHCARP